MRLAPNPNAIEREGDSRYLDVDASVEGADLGSVENGINETLEGVTFPRGTHVEVLGEYQERQAAQSRLLATAGLVAVLVLLLLHAALRRWRLALLVFFTLPIALVGGVLAAWAFGGIISLGSLATGLALVPLVLLGERPGHEIEHPVAVVILGGLVTSTLLTLLILPSLYLRFGRPRQERVPALLATDGPQEA